MNNIIIRSLKKDEIHLLDDFLYEAIFLPEGSPTLPRSIIEIPEVKVYIENFGSKVGDHCLVADMEGKVIGAVWIRILSGPIKGHGNIDEETPEFSISLYKEFRSQGIGKRLMTEMITLLKEYGYKQASLSVQKDNYAVKLYTDLGFEIIQEHQTDYVMKLTFPQSL
ncbi:GNAT family N-acetyltransferase [Porphyromonas sp.]|uniref:GNAT family N-acetyltransferase n=1 Tax=Porphyromonas sp. TaxID=1924944 RepID=UPI0026DC2B1B|nr:GNAT family N-acetyltransferase [Porphyromonas sp.]MDO4695708.1 GNAT family N-acetyltransferase [Porphyromonas sp.]MDO4770782.1 GNAT family N-acetyltransferase [Porphyromonas sp.]